MAPGKDGSQQPRLVARIRRRARRLRNPSRQDDRRDCSRAPVEIDGRPDGAMSPDGRVMGTYCTVFSQATPTVPRCSGASVSKAGRQLPPVGDAALDEIAGNSKRYSIGHGSARFWGRAGRTRRAFWHFSPGPYRVGSAENGSLKGSNASNTTTISAVRSPGRTGSASAAEQGYVERDGARIWYSTYGAGAPGGPVARRLGHSGNWGYQLAPLLEAAVASCSSTAADMGAARAMSGPTATK